MAYITVNQIIDVFKDIADRHLMINDFGNGPTYNIGTANELKFPYLWVENGDINTVFSVNGMREKRLTFNLYLMDKINKGDNNFDEIISDTEFILSGIIQEFSQLPFYVQNKLSLFQDINLTPVVEATDDNVNGWQATISLKIPIPYTYCEMPIRPYVTPVIPIPPIEPCIFEPISIQNSLSCEFLNLTSYPTGGIAVLPTIAIGDSGGIVDNAQAFSGLTITNGIINNITQDDNCDLIIDIASFFPILVTNGTCLIDTILSGTAGGSIYTLPTVEISNNSTPFGDYLITNNINIISDAGIDSVTNSLDGCSTTITMDSVFPIKLITREGCQVDTITASTVNFVLPAVRLFDDGGAVGDIFPGTQINIIGGTVSATSVSGGGCITNITLDEPEPETCFPIYLLNSNGCEIDIIEECPSNCTGYNWTINVGIGASLTNLRLLDCDGNEYDVIPSLTAGTYTVCHSSVSQPIPDSQVGLTQFLNTFEICEIKKFTLPDITITDGDSFTATTATTNNIIVNGASISSIESDGCDLTINVSCGSGSTNNGVFYADNSVSDLCGVNYASNLPNLARIANTIDNVYMSAIGERHILAIRNFVIGTGGELWVWGLNTSGSIGGSPDFQWTRIGSDSDWTHVTAGLNTSMAIKSGALYGAGAGANFIFGNNSTGNLTTFTQIGSDTDWQFVTIGENHSMAIKGGDLFSCGSNTDFRTALNTSAGNTQTWTLANGAEVWSFVSCGRSHGIGVTTDGKLYSWGVNSLGRTGQGTTAGSTQIPIQIGTDTDWVMCQAGNQTSYAIKSTGTAWGCGSSNASYWGNSSPSVMTQDSTGNTDWDWLVCNTANSVFARKTNGTLYSAGSLYGNGLLSTTQILTQVGTDNNYEKNNYGNHGGFAGETSFIKS